MEPEIAFGMIVYVAAALRFHGIREVSVEVDAHHGGFSLHRGEMMFPPCAKAAFCIDSLASYFGQESDDFWKDGKGSRTVLTLRDDLSAHVRFEDRRSDRIRDEEIDLQDFRALAMSTTNPRAAVNAMHNALFDHPFSGHGRDALQHSLQGAVRSLCETDGDIEISSEHADRIAAFLVDDLQSEADPGAVTDRASLVSSVSDHLRRGLLLDPFTHGIVPAP